LGKSDTFSIQEYISYTKIDINIARSELIKE